MTLFMDFKPIMQFYSEISQALHKITYVGNKEVHRQATLLMQEKLQIYGLPALSCVLSCVQFPRSFEALWPYQGSCTLFEVKPIAPSHFCCGWKTSFFDNFFFLQPMLSLIISQPCSKLLWKISPKMKTSQLYCTRMLWTQNTASLEQLNPMMHERSPLSPSTSILLPFYFSFHPDWTSIRLQYSKVCTASINMNVILQLLIMSTTCEVCECYNTSYSSWSSFWNDCTSSWDVRHINQHQEPWWLCVHCCRKCGYDVCCNPWSPWHAQAEFGPTDMGSQPEWCSWLRLHLCPPDLAMS